MRLTLHSHFASLLRTCLRTWGHLPFLRRRALVAILIGGGCALFSYVRLTFGSCAGARCEAGDFTWAHRGMQQLLIGENPYRDPTLGKGRPFPSNDPLFYPLPALLVALPFTPFPREVAGALFVGVSTGLLAFGLFREHFRDYPLLLSAPFWFAIISGQWSPLLVAAVLLRPLLPLTLAKPNIGLPLLLSYPTKKGVIASVGVLLLSLLVLPSWPVDWFRNVVTHSMFRPLWGVPGVVLLLALVHWRRAEARLLVLLALAPQRPLYDQLPLWLIARRGKTSRPMLILSILSWGTVFGWLLIPAWNVQWIVWGMYLPALIMVLRQAPSPSPPPRPVPPTQPIGPAEANSTSSSRMPPTDAVDGPREWPDR